GMDVAPNMNEIILERADAVDEADSGWFLGNAFSKCDYKHPSTLNRCSLYEMAIRVPSCILFLALPVGSRVLRQDDTVHLTFHGRPVPATKDSLMKRWRFAARRGQNLAR